MRPLLIITTLLVATACQHRQHKPDAEIVSSTTCASMGMQDMAQSYDVGSAHPMQCLAVNKSVGALTHVVQISLAGINDKTWPHIFVVWTGTVLPATGISYPMKPKEGTKGFFGLFTSMITPSDENAAPEITDAELSFSSIAEQVDDITQGVLTLHQGEKVTAIAFAAKTTFQACTQDTCPPPK